MKVRGNKGVVPATDIQFKDEVLEDEKRTLQQRINIARRAITMEANSWEKQLIKCENKAKEERLTSSTKNHLRSAS